MDSTSPSHCILYLFGSQFADKANFSSKEIITEPHISAVECRWQVEVTTYKSINIPCIFNLSLTKMNWYRAQRPLHFCTLRTGDRSIYLTLKNITGCTNLVLALTNNMAEKLKLWALKLLSIRQKSIK
ncbi:hypothetical protein KIL84_021793 [Mauremys mutica]|uniref:Uncharacterized protein n=1 Tax=Mauremys mutica TaxID=74926 RepID=A0A9D3XHM0_9SAUR|nr:hypothetical protein KIL84_021793 [Mauremys mutica]